jgi:hypothetical protein
MAFTEDRLKKLSLIVKQLKTAIYSLINEYRKLIHMVTFKEKDFTKMCRITNGEIDETGKIYVTKEILDQFKDRFSKKCLAEASQWIKYFQSLDIFIRNMFNFDDPIILLKEKDNKQLHYIYGCWFGDIHKKKRHEQGLLTFLDEIEKKKQHIHNDLFRELNKVEDNEEDDTLLKGLPL